MDHKQRHKRVRLLVKKVNKLRKQQAIKIDILCNNLIESQRDFIKKLNTICFTANFYESIIGTTDLNSLLYIAGKLIKDEIPGAAVAFFLRQGENFQMHLFENEQPISIGRQQLENSFTNELMDNICKANKICTLDDMFAMGLQLNLSKLNKISAVTIPMCQVGLSLGFILIYRCSRNKLSFTELDNLCSITSGLSRAISSCQIPAHSGD